MTSTIGVIGGSGLYALKEESDAISVSIDTPYSDKPILVYTEKISTLDVVFIPRHGILHNTPPHQVNYRANLSALELSGVDVIVAVNVVGGITETMLPGTIVIPDQIIDYTWGREHTFFDLMDNAENHVDFSWPFDKAVREAIAQSAASLQLDIKQGAVYGCTQGPRLETAAEIKRLKNDGCDIVGMTAMPEAALARELKIPYAGISLVVNCAAGLTEEEISFAEITQTLDEGIGRIRKILQVAIPQIP